MDKTALDTILTLPKPRNEPRTLRQAQDMFHELYETNRL